MLLVTAPTSNIGSTLVDLLLQQDADLRLIARDPAKLDARVRDRVEVVAGSHGDPAAIDAACRGVDAVFWLTPNDPAAATLDASFADFARPACEAFARHGVERVVGISALGRDTPLADDAGCVTASLAMDDTIAASGVAYRAVVCPSFMDNLLNHVGAIKEQGRFFMTIDPDLEAPLTACSDIAELSARLLLDGTWSGAGEVPCLGPEDLSPNDLARIASQTLGIPVAYQQIPNHAFAERMSGFGMGQAMVQGLIDMFDAKNQGLDTARPRTPESTAPTTFATWCRTVLAPAIDS